MQNIKIIKCKFHEFFMKLQELIDNLKKTPAYQEFKEKEPSSFLCAGFFVLDLDEGGNKYQLDFFLPNKKKVAITEFPFLEINIQPDEMPSASPLLLSLETDLDELEEKIGEIKEKNNSKMKTNKIIAVLKDNIWNLTCLSNTMDLLRIKLNAETGEVLKFEKSGLMEMIRIEKKS
jgi:hypothetical protein